jgi:hypothetical protein
MTDKKYSFGERQSRGKLSSQEFRIEFREERRIALRARFYTEISSGRGKSLGEGFFGPPGSGHGKVLIIH